MPMIPGDLWKQLNKKDKKKIKFFVNLYFITSSNKNRLDHLTVFLTFILVALIFAPPVEFGLILSMVFGLCISTIFVNLSISIKNIKILIYESKKYD